MFLGAYEITLYYVYTGNPFDDDCIAVTHDKNLAIDVMRKNALWGSYVVDCADHYIAGNFRRYCESFNYNDTISF